MDRALDLFVEAEVGGGDTPENLNESQANKRQRGEGFWDALAILGGSPLVV